MYGTGRLPGVEAGKPFILNGTIWRGSPETLAFSIANVGGSIATPVDLPLGTVVVESATDGTYAPLAANAIISTVANLPGTRVGIVAEETAKTGTTVTVEGDEEGQTSTETTIEKVLIGIRGSVDKARLIIDGTAFGELTETQQLNLCRQLVTWGIIPVDVEQC